MTDDRDHAVNMRWIEPSEADDPEVMAAVSNLRRVQANAADAHARVTRSYADHLLRAASNLTEARERLTTATGEHYLDRALRQPPKNENP